MLSSTKPFFTTLIAVWSSLQLLRCVTASHWLGERRYHDSACNTPMKQRTRSLDWKNTKISISTEAWKWTKIGCRRGCNTYHNTYLGSEERVSTSSCVMQKRLGSTGFSDTRSGCCTQGRWHGSNLRSIYLVFEKSISRRGSFPPPTSKQGRGIWSTAGPYIVQVKVAISTILQPSRKISSLYNNGGERKAVIGYRP